jgi:hypothetical protein
MVQSFDGGEGGWITGEAQRQDIVMTKAVIEVVAEASKQLAGETKPL